MREVFARTNEILANCFGEEKAKKFYSVKRREFARLIDYLSKNPVALTSINYGKGIDVISLVCETLGVSYDDVMSSSKRRDLVDARCIIATICHECEEMHYSEIARLLRVHRATIYAYLDRCQDLMRYDDFKEKLDKIKSKIITL